MNGIFGVRLKRSGRKFGRWSEAGQGTLEYILVLAIVVVIILSLLYRFNDAFRKYAASFFDGYIACLLEVGELPGTGSKCQSEYTAFNPKAGKELVSSKFAPGNKGLPGGKGDQGKSGKNGGKGGEVVAGSGSKFPVGSLAGSGRNRVANLGSLGGSGPGDDSSNSGELSGLNSTPMGNMRGGYRPRSTAMEVNQSGGIEEASDKAEQKTRKTGKTVDDSNSLRPSRAVENMERKIAKAADDKEGGFSIGGLIRLFIIILIIVAMVVFFGNQVMQVMRSRDKGGGD